MSSYICPICRDLLSEPREIEPGTNRDEYHPAVTYCGHLFHLRCLMGWFYSLRQRGLPFYTCPTCSERILATDVVRIYPASDDRFEDYMSLQRRAQKLSRDNEILTGELEIAKENLHVAAEVVAQTEEKVEELTEQLGSLQLQVNLNKEDDLEKMKSVCIQTEEQPPECDNQNFSDSAHKASNFQNILKYIQLLVNEKECSSSAANTRTSTRGQGHPVSYVRGRNPRKPPHSEEVLKKIKNLFTSYDVFDA